MVSFQKKWKDKKRLKITLSKVFLFIGKKKEKC